MTLKNESYALKFKDAFFVNSESLHYFQKMINQQNSLTIGALMASVSVETLLSVSDEPTHLFDEKEQCEAYKNKVIENLEMNLASIDLFSIEDKLEDLAKHLHIEKVEFEGSESKIETNATHESQDEIWYLCAFYESEGFQYYGERDFLGTNQAQLVGKEDASVWSTADRVIAIEKAKQVSRQMGIYVFPSVI